VYRNISVPSPYVVVKEVTVPVEVRVEVFVSGEDSTNRTSNETGLEDGW
jgi:hypothetical protein